MALIAGASVARRCWMETGKKSDAELMTSRIGVDG